MCLGTLIPLARGMPEEIMAYESAGAGLRRGNQAIMNGMPAYTHVHDCDLAFLGHTHKRASNRGGSPPAMMAT